MVGTGVVDGSANVKQDRLRVVIVGGSVAGLTLAHCLHHNNIDFVVLEAGKEIAPQLGASIVVLPNGARILDQLGIFDEMTVVAEPLETALTWTGDGKLLIDSDAPRLCEVRTGYALAFLQRCDLLKVLSSTVHDQSTVHTSKRVYAIDHHDMGVVVHCEDGTEYSGDIVVGADGIRSTVRFLMQQHIETTRPGVIEKDRNSISAEYSCIFGIGNPVEGVVKPGDGHRSYSKNYSTLSFVGRGGKLYWFLFSKLEKRCHGNDIPRYTTADMEEAVKAFYQIYMTDTITFREVWEQRTFANMLCIEESKNEHWTSDRFVCLGDAVHKMTPNLGAGGNAAIESAAALANSLSGLTTSKPSLEEVQNALTEFYTKRQLRANAICDLANGLTRIEALATLPDKIMALYAIPALGDFLTDVTCDGIVGAEILNALPVPARSLTATMPWNPESGVGKHESRWKRAMYALPLLLILYGSYRTLGAVISQLQPSIMANKELGKAVLDDDTVVSLCTKFFGIKYIDSFIAPYVSLWTPSLGNFDVAGRMQAIAFLGDLVPIQVIWMVEGLRRGNFVTAAHLLPTVFGILYQVFGIAFIAPVYYFLHYVQSPLEKYAAADNRMTQIGAVKTIIPSIAISYVLPSIAMLVAPSLATRQWVNGTFWQPFPIYAAILQRLFGRFAKDTTGTDRIKSPEADMRYLRRAYGFAIATAACSNLYVRFGSPVSMFDVFFNNLSNPSAAVPLLYGAAKALRYDQIATFSAGAIWTMLSFSDLGKAGKLRAGWGRIVGTFVGATLIAGPGAAMAIMWAWREEALAKRKDIPVEENYNACVREGEIRI